ncbi:glycoside hydrolase family 65 protein [Metabacillus endolithicus]|uniref:Glycoside hydrolase family 65 protein n=1 Tax=Metabacillus endolithicus TaxID=1535204 RepID=A0ABW5C355_9BACI|nr:glycosyl hydrolase family 65 protein [Metabacillus endolithicus]UPG62173.1 family 65 glycosyl hydrolase [Metabacillus endolithicus]
MTWKIERNDLSQQELLNLESLFSLANGYIGIRGNFEEGYSEEFVSIRGTYLNAFHDITEITYGEKLYAFPETQQKLVNNIDAQTIDIFIDKEHFSLFEGEVLSYKRVLHLDQGYTERLLHYRTPSGKEVKLQFRRIVSFSVKELFAIEVKIEPVNFNGEVRIVSKVDGDVSNYVNRNDPRVAAGHAKLLSVENIGEKDDIIFVEDKTTNSDLKAACTTKHILNVQGNKSTQIQDKRVEVTYTFELDQPVEFVKYNVYTDTLRHERDLVEKGIEMHGNLSNQSFDQLIQSQKDYLDEFWNVADIKIEGEEKLQEGIRFNLYQLLQSAGRDKYSNIAAKGLSGEGYEGHYFWDTEIYMIPVFLLTKPELAKQLLIYRYSILDGARQRAKEMGHSKGALFPWRTISGSECSAYFPAGTAQYHISADIAYSFIQYYLATKDINFMVEYGAEVLSETARLWMDTGHFYQDEFRIDDVTGPDEYTCLVNNNYYTNVMAKHNLKWAYSVYNQVRKEDPTSFKELSQRLDLTEEEARDWNQAAEKMYLPYDEELGINPQDDTFLKKAVWDFEHTPKEKYPLLLHYHPLTLYRYQVCKQADTVLAHFLLEDEQSFETIKASYDYYEKITTHDSSLSSAIFSIMAAKVGYYEKAYDYFMESARLDLDNTHGNTKDGLHMANMGGTWMSIIHGFGGVRVKESGLSIHPVLPEQWTQYEFTLHYLQRQLRVKVEREQMTVFLEKGDRLDLTVYGKNITLEEGKQYTGETSN